MDTFLKFFLIAIAGYALGNISMGMVVSKAFGIADIRKQGSGNIGTTNVLRNLGWVAGVLTLLGDVLKGYLAARLGAYVAGDLGMLFGGTFAIVGHDFPIGLDFKGGKGIATSLGLIFAIDWRIAMILFLSVIVIVAITRYMSLGSVIAAVAFPILCAIFGKGTPFIICAVCASLLALYKHYGNLTRLFRGEENRLDFDKISKITDKLRKKH